MSFHPESVNSAGDGFSRPPNGILEEASFFGRSDIGRFDVG